MKRARGRAPARASDEVERERLLHDTTTHLLRAFQSVSMPGAARIRAAAQWAARRAGYPWPYTRRLSELACIRDDTRPAPAPVHPADHAHAPVSPHFTAQSQQIDADSQQKPRARKARKRRRKRNP